MFFFKYCIITESTFFLLPLEIELLFDFWNLHGIMNTSGLLQSKWRPKGLTLTLPDTRRIHDSMNIPNMVIIAYIYIVL